jgi:hypothetical protein
MAEETKPLNLQHKLLNAMADIGNVPKEGKNQQGPGYAYQKIADMLPKVQAAFIKHGIIFIADHVKTEWHEPHESKGGARVSVCSVTMKYIIGDIHDDKTIVSQASGFAFDTSDKAENKAKTAALKYFLKQTFLIGEEEDDSERENVETRYRKPTQQGATRGRVIVKPDGQGAQGSARSAPREPKPDSPNKADKAAVYKFWADLTKALGVNEAQEWIKGKFIENDIDPADPKKWDKVLEFMLINWRRELDKFEAPPPTDESMPPADTVDDGGANVDF